MRCDAQRVSAFGKLPLQCTSAGNIEPQAVTPSAGNGESLQQNHGAFQMFHPRRETNGNVRRLARRYMSIAQVFRHDRQHRELIGVGQPLTTQLRKHR